MSFQLTAVPVHLGGEAASLSLGHNSASEAQQELGFKLTGSQKKTAHALTENIKRMISEAGIESVVFVTFTLGQQDQWGDWEKVYEASEAGRRFNNLARRILGELFEKFIVVTERHHDGRRPGQCPRRAPATRVSGNGDVTFRGRDTVARWDE